MKVASILKTKGTRVETARPDTSLYTVVWDLKLKGIGALVVSEDGATILGLISERDIVRGLAEHGPKLLGLPVSQLMTSSVVTCTPEDSITAVMAQMTRHRVRHLPVVESGRLCGMVSIGDVVKHRLDELEMEANILREILITSH
ncbi:MAG: CBS domain-containing protein [Candidatus Rokubacteria bacterium]|nr:CBS domain-containing protein [Candidatus Rokubacteria bacterium]MBI2554708.1 CBS domain-containing protein [Candidatus Rokubacteria bacterium]